MKVTPFDTTCSCSLCQRHLLPLKRGSSTAVCSFCVCVFAFPSWGGSLDSLWVAVCLSKLFQQRRVTRRQEGTKESFENGMWNWCNCLKHFALLRKYIGFHEMSVKCICAYSFYLIATTQVGRPPHTLSYRKLHSCLLQHKHFLSSICQYSGINVSCIHARWIDLNIWADQADVSHSFSLFLFMSCRSIHFRLSEAQEYHVLIFRRMTQLFLPFAVKLSCCVRGGWKSEG